MNEPRAFTAPTVRCPNCERDVPRGAYCGACGAHLAAGSGVTPHRHQAYAADPDQHMIYPSVISTLFPHIPHRRMLPFQEALAVITVLLVLLGLLRWTGPSIALASLAVPVLYLVYLYEVEVYEDEPVLVIGATVVFGALLGTVWAYFSGPTLTDILLRNTVFGASFSRIIEGGVLLPLVAQVLMLAGAMVLFTRRRYDEALDGFTFGAAGALGFTAAETLVNLLPSLRDGLTSSASSTDSLLIILTRGLCVPLVNAGLTGLVAGALWLQRGPIRRLRYHRLLVSLGTVLIGTIALRVALGVAAVVLADPLSSIAAFGGATILVLVWVRVAIHHMLLTEAVEVPIGPDFPCSHCHALVPRMAFCPNCGIATRATPKTGAGRAGRAVR
ncbi:MAG TPA: PrsW family glutamic-type intramembrane protease [Chloroflexota bacterium]|nr:PrsW family glutamic-type intramembrane protease [Chloroflexota bacterium]